MARNLFRGAPELSRLFTEAPIELMNGFLSHPQFAEFLGEDEVTGCPDIREGDRNEAMGTRLRNLGSDRIALIEVQARRITAMADETPDALLRRLGENPRFGAHVALGEQRDAVARSLWAYVACEALFAAAERAMHVKISRGQDKLYEMWSIDASIPLSAAEVDAQGLATEISDRLQHDDGCKVEVVDLPSEDGGSREVLLAVTFFGAYASQKTVRPDRTTEILYFRPPDELLLVYSQGRRRIEVCSRDPTERRLVANIFAADALEHDVSNKPLTQKTYNLARFRRSLKLSVPEEEAHRVSRAGITEVQVALGDWSRRVTLTVGPEDDIDDVARSVFGAIMPKSGGGYVTRVRFHIEHRNDRGRKATLKFDVFGRNKSNIQNERDPAKRALGYGLLESWGVLERVGDLSVPERTEKLSQLLALYDLPEPRVSGRLVDDLGIESGKLTGAGFLTRQGWSDVVLFEDDELGEFFHDVQGGASEDEVMLTVNEGGSGPHIPAEDITWYEVRFEYLRDVLRKVLEQMGLRGKVREVADHVHQVGAAQIGLAEAPIYLARALAEDKLLERADRLIRGEGNRARGIVFVPEDVRFPYMGAHVVLSIRDCLDPETGQIDAEAVRVAYEASVDPAARGGAVHFRKQGEAAGQITVPGQESRIVTGAKKVRLFERLYQAHRERAPGVKLEYLKEYAGFSQLPQLFGDEWSEIKNRYIHSPRRSYWALCEAPISV